MFSRNNDSLEGWVDAMFCVGRNENVPADVHAGPGALLERDDRKPIEKVIEYLFAFLAGLRGDAVANLRRRIEDAAVVADLGQSSQSTDGCGGAKSLR